MGIRRKKDNFAAVFVQIFGLFELLSKISLLTSLTWGNFEFQGGKDPPLPPCERHGSSDNNNSDYNINALPSETNLNGILLCLMHEKQLLQL